MSAKSRKEVLEQARQRYGKRGREGRSRLLDEVCELCGYERKYAIKVLGGKRAIIGSNGRKRGSFRAQRRLRDQAARDCVTKFGVKDFFRTATLERLQVAVGEALAHLDAEQGT